MSITGEDLDAAPASADPACAMCRLEWWACACDPTRPWSAPTPEEIEDAREQRLTRGERARGGA